MLVDDAHMVLRDEALFFQIVQTTPDFVEAEDLLRRAREAALREKAALVLKGNTKQDQALNVLVAKLNHEIAYYARAANRAEWQNAIEALWGKEGYHQALDWVMEYRRTAKP